MNEKQLNNLNYNQRFESIWNHFSEKNLWASVSLEDIKGFAETKKIIIQKVEETSFGYSPSIKAVILKTDAGSAVFPREKLNDIELYNKNIGPSKNYEDFWTAVDWFLPPFIPLGKLSSVIQKANIDVMNHKEHHRHDLQQRFEYSLTSIYDVQNFVPMIQDTLSKSSVVGEHVPLIREAVFAFYSGMKTVAIAGLIPIVENVLTQIVGDDKAKIDTHSKINKCIQKAKSCAIRLHLNEADWVPAEYITDDVLKVMNKRIFMLESLRSWLKNSFYENTDNYKQGSGFNRIIFAHAKSDVWQNSSNFFRALGVIQAMAFIECFAVEGNKISLLGPTFDEKSESFRNEIFACMNFQSIKQHIIEQQQISNKLPFNPTSSDDGWLRRSAILSKKMDSIIVVRLRDNGWDCHTISDPVKDGEYITVEANKQDKSIRVALLYSCASDRDLYQFLAKKCDCILFQGETYHLDEFAGKYTTIIRSLNAWIAPV